ncbi:MAG: hypothetical protein ACIWVG_04285 [Gloeotrichia echinulata HAB0833]
MVRCWKKAYWKADCAITGFITATAHKLARIFYRLWTSGDRYTDPGIDTYEQQYRERTLKNLKKKAQAFGLELIPISNPTECGMSVDRKQSFL